jgi:ribonucleoside-diphosphate reductase alpha chain
MSSYKNFQSKNKKHTQNRSFHDAEFNNPVKMVTDKQQSNFLKKIDRWENVISYYRWFP